MENRRSSRRLLRQEIGLDVARIGPLSALSHDMSLGGMFVETGRPMALQPNTSVTVLFNLGRNGRRETFQLDAAVVRCTPAGVGLMFLQMEPEVIRALSGALAAYH